MICRCGERTGNEDGGVIGPCAYHVQALLLPPDWLAKIPPCPTWTRETNEIWLAKMRAQRAKVVEVIRQFDQDRKKEAA